MQHITRSVDAPIGVVERNRIHNVLVAFERQELVAGLRVPDLARAVVAPGDEPARARVRLSVARVHRVRPRRVAGDAKTTHLSPDLLNAQFVSGRMCARRILNK